MLPVGWEEEKREIEKKRKGSWKDKFHDVGMANIVLMDN